MQQQIKIEGVLAACNCGRQPKHYLWHGKNQHFLECSPCGTRTALFPTFQEAVESWERHDAGVIRNVK